MVGEDGLTAPTSCSGDADGVGHINRAVRGVDATGGEDGVTVAVGADGFTVASTSGTSFMLRFDLCLFCFVAYMYITAVCVACRRH